MKHYIRGVSWRFNDYSSVYPELKGPILQVNSPNDVAKLFSFLFKNQVRERFVVALLNSANRVTGFEIVTEGILNSQTRAPTAWC